MGNVKWVAKSIGHGGKVLMQILTDIHFALPTKTVIDDAAQMPPTSYWNKCFNITIEIYF